mgnify:CR=1 FL=1|jgi:hypothetical protein
MTNKASIQEFSTLLFDLKPSQVIYTQLKQVDVAGNLCFKLGQPFQLHQVQFETLFFQTPFSQHSVAKEFSIPYDIMFEENDE